LYERFQSRGLGNTADRILSAMRHEFGGHPYGKDDAVARERREGRVGR